MNSNAIRDRLLARARALLEAPREKIEFTSNPKADALLNDIRRRPHAFVLGCIVDRQIAAERAWMIPFHIAVAIGGDSFASFARLSLPRIRRLMSYPKKLHRFPEGMARNLHEGIRLIGTKYDGDASRIWRGRPSSAAVVSRFLEFRGVGPKIATMATNILVRRFKVPLSDYYSVDISADVHVRRVFSRLGLVPEKPTPEQVIYRARALSPEFPGLLDTPCFRIGREWCRPRQPRCCECYMRRLCPSAREH